MAAGIAASYLAQPEHLAEIAACGYELVGRKHSANARAGDILALAARLRDTGAHEKRLREQAQVRTFVRTSFGIIASDLQDPAKNEIRDYFAREAQR